MKYLKKSDFEKTDLGYWMLPKPDKIKKWERIPRLSNKTIPFGYVLDEDDPRWLNPVPKELELLELAKKHLKQYSYRNVAAWLTTQSGRSISHEGLKRRVDVERKRKSLIAIKRKLAKWLEETIEQYEALEKERLGYHTYEYPNRDYTKECREEGTSSSKSA